MPMSGWLHWESGVRVRLVRSCCESFVAGFNTMTKFPALSIEPMTEADWPAVAEIYRQGIAGGNATFETEVPEWRDFDARHLLTCRLVARIGRGEQTGVGALECVSADRGGEIAGWTALSRVSAREVYAGVAEVSIYIEKKFQGCGVGSKLLAAVIEESERKGIWTLQAGILAENETSVRLHERHGFRVVGIREKIGRRDGRWRDTILMERRSSAVGV